MMSHLLQQRGTSSQLRATPRIQLRASPGVERVSEKGLLLMALRLRQPIGTPPFHRPRPQEPRQQPSCTNVSLTADMAGREDRGFEVSTADG